MTFDRFHVAAKLSEAVNEVRRNEVRRAEVKTRPELKCTRWLWLKNWTNLSAKQQGELHQLMRPSAKLATARALRWREDSPSLLRPAPLLRARVPATLVLRRETLPPPTHQRLRHPRRAPLGRPSSPGTPTTWSVPDFIDTGLSCQVGQFPVS